MKIDYISDLHVDFWIKENNPQSPKFKKQLETFIGIIKPNYHDVLIIAGDLGHYYSQDSAVLLRLKDFYKNIFIVPGNHDMYLVSNSIQKTYMLESWNRVLEMKNFCRDNEGFYYLDGNRYVVDGISFAGCGMSWDGSYAKTIDPYMSDDNILKHWNSVMNDSRLIFSKGKENFKIPLAYGAYYNVSSFNPTEFFQSQYEKLLKIDKADVMITHYGPKIPSKMKDDYKDLVTTAFYYFDGVGVLDSLKPKYWVYGHTHDKYSDEHGDTKLICNPLGYPGEDTYTVIETFEIETL